MPYLRLTITDDELNWPKPLPFPGREGAGDRGRLDLAQLDAVLDRAQSQLDELTRLVDEEIESFKFPVSSRLSFDPDDEGPRAA